MYGNGFPIVSVAGARSGVGKTTLCSILLRELKGFGAIKFTKTSLYTSVVDDCDILDREGKDTSIMRQSGDAQVLWVRSPVDGLEATLMIALAKLTGVRGVVVEGNSPVDFLNPHLIIFIMDDDGEIKSTARDVNRRADIIVINTKTQDVKESFPVPGSSSTAALFRINLKEEIGDISKFLTYVQRKLS